MYYNYLSFNKLFNSLKAGAVVVFNRLGRHAFQTIHILVSTNVHNYFLKNFVDKLFVTALNFTNSENKLDLIKMLTNQWYHLKNTCFTSFFLKLHNGQIEFQLTQNTVLQTNPDFNLTNELLRAVN